MKSIILCACIVLGGLAASAQNSLMTSLPATAAMADATVTVLKDQTILIRYTQNDISYMVFYDKDGVWLHTVVAYWEPSLPASVRRLVKASWHGWDIGYVKEVRSPMVPPVYQIQMKRGDRLVILNVSDEGIETEKEL